MQTIAAKRLDEQLGPPLSRATRAGASEASRGSRKPLAVELHRSIEEIEFLWRSMDTVRSCPIHQTYDWCRSWVKTQGAVPLVAVGRLGNDVAFLLPLELVLRHGIRVARYIATPFSNINNGIFTEAGRRFFAEPKAGEAFIRQMREKASGVDCILLDKLPFEWRGEPHPLAGLPHLRSADGAFQITLGCTFEDLLSRTNAKRKRKKYRTTTRRLEAAGGWEHVIAETPEAALRLLEVFFRQKGVRLRARGLPDVFAAGKTRRFFRDLARQMPRGDRHPLQLHAIRLGGADGHPCAIAGLSRNGDHLICQFASVDDTACPDTSPGELLFHLMIENACRDNAAVFDFGIGDQRYKRSWCDMQTAHFDVVLPLTARGRLFAAGYRAAISAKRFVKRNPRASRAINRLRALTARQEPADGR